MSYYTSLHGKIRMSRRAWESVKDLIVPGYDDSLHKAMCDNEGGSTHPVWERSGVYVDMYGSRLPCAEVLNILCAAKDHKWVDTLYGQDCEEMTRHIVYIWPHAWSEFEYVPPPEPSAAQRRRKASTGFYFDAQRGIAAGEDRRFIYSMSTLHGTRLVPPKATLELLPKPLVIKKGRVHGDLPTV